MNDLNTIREYKAKNATQGGLASMSESHHSPEVGVREVAAAAGRNVEAVYDNTAQAAIAAKANMIRAYNDLCAEFPAFEKRAKDHIAKVNDLTGRVAQSLAKSKDIMGPQVEERLRQLERFVDAMERLAKLDADGVVARFGAALKK